MIDQHALQKFNHLIERRKTIKSSQGFKAWSEISNSRMSYLIFLENNRSTKISMKRLNTIDIFSFPDEVRWRKQRKLVKDVHNTVGSAISFRDHLTYRNNYNPSLAKVDVLPFFKLLRNFLIHVDTFSLTSRSEWNIDTGTKRYHAMNKITFLSYLESRLNENLGLEGVRALKERKQLEDTIDFMQKKPELFDFQPHI